ncbi:uncharacterized protein [Glycine max]|uniref:uncharacterized protein n=1 Tax=Glycine max TaxID=3847 RepID=UPI000E21B2E0|nr:uncharacterized protein LOC112998722 [Glycine max]|eukprot:XP_025980637.1 uncharacterized protein LOC112998722 [Glycine max]
MITFALTAIEELGGDEPISYYEAVNTLNPTLILFYGRNVIVLSYYGLNPPYQKKALSLVVRATSSHMAWTAIEKTFQAQTRARRMAMKVQLQTLTKRSLSMLEYIERKRFIADSLAENLHPISDEDLIGYILSSLDSSYSAFSTAFIMKSDDVSVDDLVGLLLQEEARLEQEHVHQAVVVSQPTNPTPLLSTSVVYTTNRFSNRSSSTNNPNNNSGSFPRRNVDNPRRRPICQLCSKPGHETIDYWQRTNQTN